MLHLPMCFNSVHFGFNTSVVHRKIPQPVKFQPNYFLLYNTVYEEHAILTGLKKVL